MSERRASEGARARAAAPALGLLLLAVAGCRPPPAAEQVAFPSGKVWILGPAESNDFMRAASPVLQSLLPGAPRAGWTEAEDALRRCAAESNVVVIADAANIPVACWGPVQDYLRRGGAAVFWGCRPFENRAVLRDGRCAGGVEEIRSMAREALPLPLPDMPSWRHRNDAGKLSGFVRLTKIPDAAWPAVSVEVGRLGEWDAMVAEIPGEVHLPDGVRALVFHAFGDAETPRLVVECEERDGSRWAHIVEVSPDWRLYGIDASGFLHVGGGENRGGPGDRFSFSRIARISMGLSMRLTPQSAGPHAFGFSSPMGIAAAAAPAWASPLPAISALSPREQRYDLRATRIVLADSGRSFLASGAAQSALPRSRGAGGELGLRNRWLPLAEAYDAGGQRCGWPASLMLEFPDGGPVVQWGWVAVDPASENLDLSAALLSAAVRRLLGGHFLYRAGCDRHAFGPGEFLKVSARCARGFGRTEGLRMAAELIDERGIVQRRVVRSLDRSEADESKAVRLDLGAAPGAISVPRMVTVRVQLEDLAGRLAFDSVEQPVLLLPAVPAKNPLPVSVVGSELRIDRTPLFLLGMNYVPVAAAAGGGREPAPHWLHPSVFDPLSLREDMERLKQVGVNALAIDYLDEEEAPQLRVVVEEARRIDQWLVIHMPCLNPLAPDADKARRLIEAAGLAEERRILAFELAREPRLGGEAERTALDAPWRTWLQEQYGSIDHAEQVIGMPLWKREGLVTGPPDEQLAADGPHRAAVEVYRRFVDDHVSRRYGAACRFLKGLGCGQLVTARHGFGGTGQARADRFLPIEPASGAAHLDFLSPVAWELYGPAEETAGAGFLSAYARGVSGGKPVVWLKAGCPANRSPTAVDLRNQARVYANMADMALRSHSSGFFGWAYAGGILPGEENDIGVVGPDGSWREAGDVFRNAARRLRGYRSAVPAWRGRAFDRATDARGLSALWDAWRGTYGREVTAGTMEEARPVGHDVETKNLEILAAGGARFGDPAPMALVNGEWGFVAVDGRALERSPGQEVSVPVRQRVRMELINTGPATWSPYEPNRSGTALVVARREGGGEDDVALKEVRSCGRAVVEWIPPDPGVWTLRPWLNRIGGFGEPLTVRVREASGP
jgi:hypothetical protein